MGDVEQFYAIRLADGTPIFGEFEWMRADGPDDWMLAEEACDEEPTEWEIVLMSVTPVARRTFGDPRALHEQVGDGWCDYCGEVWPCEYLRTAQP